MDEVWYYMKKENKKKYGPYSDDELKALIRQEILSADDYIWMPDLSGWLKVGNSIYSIFIPGNEEEEDTSEDTVEAPVIR